MQVSPKPEPLTFNSKVRSPGIKWVKSFSDLSLCDPDKKPLWRKSLDDLREAYNSTCAYLAHWLPPAISAFTVDHFLPKTKYKLNAYDWSNFRLACGLANSLKNEFEDVIDPFIIKNDWFIMTFPGLIIKANPNLGDAEKQQVESTIERLQLNKHIQIKKLRSGALGSYCLGKYPFEYLKEIAPFIAYELERQNLVVEIINIWSS